MNAPRMAEIAALAGDPARANMLARLMDGRALTASELATVAGVSAQTASGHLAKLTASGLLSVTKQGRHRYYRLATPDVARMIEQIMVVAGDSRSVPRRGSHQDAICAARTCYDHVAGRLGVGIADALVRRRHVVLTDESGEVTKSGRRFFENIGIDPAGVPGQRPYCRPCLDWTERRPHLAGKLGAAMAKQFFDQGWLQRQPASRALAVTPAGRRVFREVFDLTL